MTISLARHRELERRFDGPVPSHLLEHRTAQAIMADNHYALVRYHRQRVTDFTIGLERLHALPPSDPAKIPWTIQNEKILAHHHAEVAKHEAALRELGL